MDQFAYIIQHLINAKPKLRSAIIAPNEILLKKMDSVIDFKGPRLLRKITY